MYLTAVGGDLVLHRRPTAATASELWKSRRHRRRHRRWSRTSTPAATAGVPCSLTAVGGTLFFTADDGSHGYELWKSDGTAAGTVLVKDINPGTSGSDPDDLTAVGGTLFFTRERRHQRQRAVEVRRHRRRHLLVKDINPGGYGGSPRQPDGGGRHAVLHGRRRQQRPASCGSPTAPPPAPCWSRTSTPATPTATRATLTAVGGTVFFTATDGTHGYELWKSDGTAAGTVLVKDINPGVRDSSSLYSSFNSVTSLGGTLFFAAYRRRQRTRTVEVRRHHRRHRPRQGHQPWQRQQPTRTV